LFTFLEQFRCHDGRVNRDVFKGAFDGLEGWDSFSYRKQLREATEAVRHELDKTVHRYVSRFPTENYRTLGRRLHISPAKLCEILRPFPHGRKPGRRKTPRMVQAHNVTVSPRAVSVSQYLEREDVKLALRALDMCLVSGKVDDAGEDSYQNLVHWLKQGQRNKALRDRAKYLVHRYGKLRPTPSP
jgi:hypothetical protein